MLALLGMPAANGQDRTFLVTDVGVGRINAETPYTVEAVSAALGGLPVTATKIHYGHFPIAVLEATRDGKRVLLAFEREAGTRVARAVSFAPESVTSTGVSIGTPMARVYGPLPDPGCRAGREQETGLVFCPAPYLDNVRFAFRCNHSTRDDTLPPTDVLARCPLERIIWLAPD